MTAIVPHTDPALSFVDHGGAKVAIRHRPAVGDRPTILFLPGYGSDMAGIKALAIDAHCAARGLGCVRLDYSGTGLSPGAFADGTLRRWLDEVLAVIDWVPDGKMLLVGSSMGGWIALHAALSRPDRIVALLGISAAPDFTEWGFEPEDKATLQRDGRIELTRPDGSLFLRTLAFWESGQAMRLLEGPIALSIPVRLVHGSMDDVVPTAIAVRLLDRLETADAQLRLIKGANHNLSTTPDLAAILAEVDALVDVAVGHPHVEGHNPNPEDRT